MKTCEHCLSSNEDGASMCIRCGSQHFHADLQAILPGGETEIFGSIARSSRAGGRWKTEATRILLNDSSPFSGSGLLEGNGLFRIQHPNINEKKAGRIFNADGRGGMGTLKVSGDVVTMLFKPRRDVSLLVGGVWGLVVLLVGGSVYSAMSSSHPSDGVIAGMIFATPILIMAAMVLWQCRSRRWNFLADRIVNARVVTLPARKGKGGVQFEVLPAAPRVENGVKGPVLARDCTSVIFAAETLNVAGQLADSLPKRRVFLSDPKMEQRAQFAQRLVAATPHVWVNPGLIILNLMVFALMFTDHRQGTAQTLPDMWRWGANYGPLTLSGDWWRLLTSCFIHFGFWHVALNMLALWWMGKITERLFGNWVYLAIYLGSGWVGCINSLCWHPLLTSAGASGAIFGVFGALTGYLARERQGIPSGARGPLGRSVVIFLLNNIPVGPFAAHIDVAAHAGGLISGLIFGFMAARPLESTARRESRGKSLALLGGSMVVTGAVWAFFLPSLPKVISTLAGVTPGAPNMAVDDAMIKTNPAAFADIFRIRSELSRMGKADAVRQALAGAQSNQVALITRAMTLLTECDVKISAVPHETGDLFHKEADRIYAQCLSLENLGNSLQNPAKLLRGQLLTQGLDEPTTALALKQEAIDDYGGQQRSVKIGDATVAFAHNAREFIAFLETHRDQWTLGAGDRIEFSEPTLVPDFQAVQERFNTADEAFQNLVMNPASIALLKKARADATNSFVAEVYQIGIDARQNESPNEMQNAQRVIAMVTKKFQTLQTSLPQGLHACADSLHLADVQTLEDYHKKKKLAEEGCAMLNEYASFSADPKQWFHGQVAAGGASPRLADSLLIQVFSLAKERDRDDPKERKSKEFGRALTVYTQSVTDLHEFLSTYWGQWTVDSFNATRFSTPDLNSAYAERVTTLKAADESLAALLRRTAIPRAAAVASDQNASNPSTQPSGKLPQLQGIFYSSSHASVLLDGQKCVEGDTVDWVRVVKIERNTVTVEWNGQTRELRMN